MPTVPRLFPGATMVLFGGGPSLTVADVDACYGGRCPAIAINNAWQLAPWAAVLYAADQKWWTWAHGAPAFAGLKYAIAPMEETKYPDVQVLRNTGPLGLEREPTGLRTGRNSGYQAVNLAVHLGAARILLLGFDMSPTPDGRQHWHAPHPDQTPSPYEYPQWLAAWPSLVEPLAAAGVTVINCSRRTVLTTFPCAPLADELARLTVAA
jgi:hypothetical protein